MPSLNNSVMERLIFPICDLSEQLRITAHVDRASCSIRASQSYLGILRLLKQGLMHDLLTGRVRVKIEELAAT